MRRRLSIDLSRNLPHRERSLAGDEAAKIFGGCVPQGSRCTSASDCCPVWLAPGDYVLCYFYRSERLVTGYCTTSSSAYGT
jgi:hypothetical protein